MSGLDRRQILFGAGLTAAVAIPAGIYGLSRVQARLEQGARGGGSDVPPLTPDENLLVAAMAEGIIPQTDTPGAIGARVPQFIAMIFAEWFFADEQAAFRQGLKNFDAEARSAFGKAFAQCAASQQLQLLNRWDRQSAQARQRGETALPAFAQFKSLTVIGYYTSEVGQMQELKAQMDGGQDQPDGPVMMPLPFRV